MASHEPWRRALSAPPLRLLGLLWLLTLPAAPSGAHASAIDAADLPAPSTTPIVATTPPTTASADRPIATPLPRPPELPSPSLTTADDGRIRESVVISTAVDAEREAQDLYDKALRQYDAYGASARNTCATWELRGCQCTLAAADELTLSCRNVGLEEVPLDLPAEIVKL